MSTEIIGNPLYIDTDSTARDYRHFEESTRNSLVMNHTMRPRASMGSHTSGAAPLPYCLYPDLDDVNTGWDGNSTTYPPPPAFSPVFVQNNPHNMPNNPSQDLARRTADLDVVSPSTDPAAAQPPSPSSSIITETTATSIGNSPGDFRYKRTGSPRTQSEGGCNIQCDFCPKRFTKDSSALRHMEFSCAALGRQKNKKFRCRWCCQRYSRSDYRKQHENGCVRRQ
ncbi:hypothetical protein DBV05_g5458 [Lasiodiplodia theobromae]|uniref:C2H2-type domain-containing protein n=1 Tax=Lasiodiplodia theobromae TaxID=45133 RepID=A0A5N5DE86_9PEZI|nr:hypothetical protein DBV05_g5458 [Lasiodiplodia theobromae]